MLLLNLQKQHVLTNDPIKASIWDRLPLTTESNFTLLNLVKPFNECWLQPLHHSSLYVYVHYVYYVFFFSCPVRCFSFPSLSILSLFFSFTYSLSTSPQPPVIPLAHGSLSPQQSPWYMVFSSIYSEATGLLKAEQLPGALLFAWDFFFSTSQVSHVISFTPTPIVIQPWADAFKRHFHLILSYSLFNNIYKMFTMFPIML